jgi:hypothetical protein
MFVRLVPAVFSGLDRGERDGRGNNQCRCK